MLNLSRPAAAKTGTTTDFRDNWTLGYTPDLAVGVWAGNANNAPMYRVTGITGAGPIWHDFMEQAHRGFPEKPFARPEGILEVEVCDASGLLATDICPRVRTELFIKGTEPKQPDDAYQMFELDAATNLIWNEHCRGPRIQRVYRVYPPDAQDWAQKRGLALAPELDCQGQLTTVGRPGGDAVPVANAKRAALEVVSPAQNSLYETSTQIPEELQRIEVNARLNQALKIVELTLYIDGTAIGTFSSVPYRALWKLSVGEHTAQAIGIAADGTEIKSDVVNFTVVQAK